MAGLVFLCGVLPATANVEVQETECWVIANARQQVDCYRILVPLDRNNPDAGQADLAVAVLRASTSNPEPDPVIYLEGGPGAPTFADGYPAYDDYSEYWWRQSAPFRRTRDFILFDQRGIGMSLPNLDCPELHELDQVIPFYPPYDYPMERREVNEIGKCYERLVAEGVRLEQFDTRNSADDVADIVQALGYDTVNLYGISYGTRLALEVMRRHPDLVRATVIDGVYPGTIDDELDFAGAVAGAFSNVFEDCQADRRCSKLAPNMASMFNAMIVDLNEEPRELELYDPYAEEPGYAVLVNGDAIVSSFIGDLYDSDALTVIPLVVGMARRDLDALTYSYGSGSFGSDGMDEGVFVNIGCREATTLDPDLLETESEAFGIYGTATLSWSIIPYCDVWPVARAPLSDEGPVVSDIPTLLFSGRYDPITPANYAEDAARTLSNSRHFVFQSGGHGVTATYDCATIAAARFIVTPDPARVPAPRCREFGAGAAFLTTF
ncbi:MAG: alpha/beta hydrolase [Alphaproteobacteria bacterium]|nr:alpha/beta fold hydrolase [Rhodospirillaceae bacterium]MBT6511623.1 alpha/beta fold hydrolase [Rhodospirillaceae bacterium]MBT7647712.1 alpha/beta fold hydrolase [Rhodospirillaceae bacterium]MDG2481696.1 alpha/beta hydrolase [Alphaproteobacteria bacterium]